MEQSLGQIILQALYNFLLCNSFLLVLLGVIFFYSYSFYYRFFRINRNTDHIDLMSLYLEREMRKKYRK